MRLQVEQLEKEKREREARLRTIAKRIDHFERAYRQEERPLLAKDYELQQASDRATFEQVQIGRVDAARVEHKRNLETKKRLSRILPEFEARKAIILEKRSAEYERKQAASQAKIEEEMAKRRATLVKAREEEQSRQAAAEQAQREAEEDERRKREGTFIQCLTNVLFSHRHETNQRKNASSRKRKPRSAKKKKRLFVCVRNATDSDWRISSVSRCNSSARKKQHGGPKSAANKCLPLQRRHQPRVCGAAQAPLRRPHRLARPRRVPKAPRRPAVHRG